MSLHPHLRCHTILRLSALSRSRFELIENPERSWASAYEADTFGHRDQLFLTPLHRDQDPRARSHSTQRSARIVVIECLDARVGTHFQSDVTTFSWGTTH